MKTGTIYRAWSPSGKSYIGQTIQSLQARKNKHKYASLEQKSNYPFHRAIRYYGWGNINWEVLHSNILQNQLNSLEIQTIEKYKAFTKGYNATSGGDSLATRDKISEASRQRMIKAHWARDLEKREEVTTKISIALKGRENWWKGKTRRPKTKAEKLNLSLKNKGKKRTKGILYGKDHQFYGKHHTQETRNKISQKLKGDNSPASILNWDQVREIRRLYNLGNLFQEQLAKLYNVSRGCISHILLELTWKV